MGSERERDTTVSHAEVTHLTYRSDSAHISLLDFFYFWSLVGTLLQKYAEYLNFGQDRDKFKQLDKVNFLDFSSQLVPHYHFYRSFFPN